MPSYCESGVGGGGWSHLSATMQHRLNAYQDDMIHNQPEGEVLFMNHISQGIN
jgi:hypothetical protein